MRSLLLIAVAVIAIAFGVSAASSAEGLRIVEKARGMVGKYPYSMGGGNNNGPTKGRMMTYDPFCNDSEVVGFDCSGLAKYSVYQALNISMRHRAQYQHDDCPNIVNVSEIEAGDLLFFGDNLTHITHVAIYVGDNQIIEAAGHFANCTGKLMLQRKLYTKTLLSESCRMWKPDVPKSSESPSPSPSLPHISASFQTRTSVSFFVLLLSLALVVFITA